MREEENFKTNSVENIGIKGISHSCCKKGFGVCVCGGGAEGAKPLLSINSYHTFHLNSWITIIVLITH